MNKLYLIQKRKLKIKEIPITSDTFVKVVDIGKTIFFNREDAQKMLADLIYLKNRSDEGKTFVGSRKSVTTKTINYFVSPDVIQLTIDDMENNQ
jgi:hypothetical protein